jgi:hypothetical protein
LNAVHNTIAAASFKPKVTAYYGTWRIYNNYAYFPYIPKALESSYTCSENWNFGNPAVGTRNWGITSSSASKIDYLNIGFATVSYASQAGYFYTNSPDENADTMSGGLPTKTGC